MTPGIDTARVALAYADPAYAASLVEFGTPRELPGSKGWILERPVPGRAYRDATGCYPLFSCQDWSRLADDVDALRGELLTLSLVADPFGAPDASELARCFDEVRPFKEHYVTDLRQPVDVIASAHHRKYARRAFRSLAVERCAEPLKYLDEWVELYAGLAATHRLSGLRAFSRQAFERQLSMEGLVMFRASREGRTAGLHLWLQRDEVAYGHLGATNALGYESAAAYGLYWFAIEWFSRSTRWLHLGGSAGTGRADADGLAAFKRGWATGTRMAYFCGCCFDRVSYDEVVGTRRGEAGSFFPAYRAGEV
jgi:hypothetical protein